MLSLSHSRKHNTKYFFFWFLTSNQLFFLSCFWSIYWVETGKYENTHRKNKNNSKTNTRNQYTHQIEFFFVSMSFQKLPFFHQTKINFSGMKLSLHKTKKKPTKKSTKNYLCFLCFDLILHFGKRKKDSSLFYNHFHKLFCVLRFV